MLRKGNPSVILLFKVFSQAKNLKIFPYKAHLPEPIETIMLVNIGGREVNAIL